VTPTLILTCFLLYTIMLFVVTWITARRANSHSFFIGNKSSPWFVVAYGMIGASLSGVTFMSVPGWVGDTQFSYLLVVAGYFFGYLVIANVLLPMYYKLNLTSIYSYLDQRFGFWSYKTGSFFFILSRTIGASFRMFLVVNVLHVFVFQQWGLPFWVSVGIFILLIILYTFKGGIKTIIWTDTLQTTFMLLAVIITLVLITKGLNLDFGALTKQIFNSKYSNVVVTDWNAKNHWLKQFFSGMFITITMTGLDQEMMQKNLSCKNLKEAKKNMLTFSLVLIVVNFMFLFLGATLFTYAQNKGIAIPARTDDLFPTLAIQYLGPVAGLVFVIGLISAAYPSADGALTSLTTAFCIDFLKLPDRKKISEKKRTRIRYLVHIGFALLLFAVIIIFSAINDRAVIDKLFTIAGYTYGPLLGLYAFGLFTKRSLRDPLVPFVAVISPVLCYLLSSYSAQLFHGYKIGFELIIINGMITFIGLWLLSLRRRAIEPLG
jgi:Na+/proline symporter